MQPICLIRDTEKGLVVSDEGIRILESLDEPLAIVCLAGQYRTGKSFFLNQLSGGNESKQGFSVGVTTESCTRGIWIWNTHLKNKRGDTVLLMDTEGMAALDNDESYDAKIFSLGLLLSSLFIFNSMGVIDEASIDRLFLVSELSKSICVHTNPEELQSTDSSPDVLDDAANEEQLSAYFPPFIWLLRDFMLEMEVDGRKLSPNEYLETALEIRTTGNSRRIEERNRIRGSLSRLFKTRECVTIVRPATDETKLRNASQLEQNELRPEFVEQMSQIKQKILSIAQPKSLFGKELNGPKLVHLLTSYIATMNSGSVPDIRGAWEYVVESTCRAAEQEACSVYDKGMDAVVAQDPPISQHEFDSEHKKYQEEALRIFKTESIEGSHRSTCFQRLKEHIISHKGDLVSKLQAKSKELCNMVCTKAKQKFLKKMKNWTGIAEFEEGFAEFMLVYDESSHGPARKPVLLQFLSSDIFGLFGAFYNQCESNYRQRMADLEGEASEKLSIEKEAKVALQIRCSELEAQLTQVKDTKAVIEERLQEVHGLLSEEKDNIKQLKQENGVVKARLESLQNQYEEERSNRLEIERQQEKLTIEYDHATVRLAEASLSVNELKQQLQSEKEQSVEALEAKRIEFENLREEYSVFSRNTEVEVDTLKGQLLEKENTCDILKRENEEKLTVLENRNLEIEQARQEIEEFEININEMQEYISTTNVLHKKEIKNLKNQNSECTEVARQLNAEKLELQTQMEVKDVLESMKYELINHSREGQQQQHLEERNALQQRLGELHVQIATLPDFYQRQIFCPPQNQPTGEERPAPRSFFEALTSSF